MGDQRKIGSKFWMPYEYGAQRRHPGICSERHRTCHLNIRWKPISALTDRSACSSTQWQPMRP